MADIFGSREGFVSVVEGQSLLPGRIRVGDFEPVAALISGVDAEQNTNQQFQYSLDGSVFIYVFGDLMGDVVVEGRAFPAICPDSAGGLGEVFAFYAAKRASQTPEPVQVVIGEESIIGFLTRLQVHGMSVAEGDAALFHSFRLNIKTLPKG